MFHYEELTELIFSNIKSSKSNVTFFSPYIKNDVIKLLINNLPSNVTLTFITKCSTLDFVNGASDLAGIKTLLENNHLVLINNRIHLKTYLFDFDNVITGSANFTNKGLGLISQSNFETLVKTNVSRTYLTYLESIIGTSAYIQLSDLDQIQKKMDELKNERISPEDSNPMNAKFEVNINSNKFLASQLPQTKSVSDLYAKVMDKEKKSAEADHDILIFGSGERIDDLDFETFRLKIKKGFMAQAFVSKLFESFQDTVNFGGVRAFFEKNCIDNPRPSRIEVNKLINNIFGWLEEFKGDDFEIYQPNHTKILVKKK